MANVLGVALLHKVSAAETGKFKALRDGVWRIEVIGDLGAATVQIQTTLDDSDLSNAKDETDVVFTEGTKKAEVMRGGVNARADLVGTPAGPITVRANYASA